MIFNLIVTDEADKEITETYLYYEGQREGLGERFLNELDKRYDQLLTNPEYYGYLSGNSSFISQESSYKRIFLRVNLRYKIRYCNCLFSS